MGGTSGRSTLLGEGLQHQDGQSPMLFSAVRRRDYDPAYGMSWRHHSDGIRRQCITERERSLYYICV